MIKRCRLLILSTYLISSMSLANDLGVFGQTYPILEEDLLNFIQRRVIEMQKNGEWAKVESKFKENTQKHVDRPSPVISLQKTVENKSWLYDPSITVPYDLKDANGRIFASAGTTVNPLKLVSIHRPLVFFNADDSEQVRWAQEINQTATNKVKLVLVNGSVTEMVKVFKQPIYFDQAGKLTSNFHIQHVPAFVEQEGIYLRITEKAI